ncbi:MAG: ankyrin repeat domain-containing protein [Campylobacterota bacterium]|nr:ankyrin repeat domain-containing protein [Campylobacterota bacterium]
MVKNLFSTFTVTIKSFEELLLQANFDVKKANSIFKTNKIDINHIDKNGDTFLDKCLRNNKFKASKWLISKKIKISKKNKDNISTIRLAIEKGDVSIVDDLIRYSDFNINQKDKNGRSLLQDAVILGNEKISNILINNNIDINLKDQKNRNVAFDAISYGDEKIVNSIISNKDLELNNIDSDGKTILHNQIVLEDDKLAEKLLINGADPTIPDNNGMNFLTHTALRGEDGADLLDVAINTGCNLNKKLANKNSVLLEVLYSFIRVSDGELQRRKELKNVAKKLIDNGSDINDIDKNGETTLFEMVRKSDVEGVAFLIENKLDVNKKNINNDTPLGIAILKGIENFDLILLLLQYGADPTIRNKHSQTIPEVLNELILHTHGLKQMSHKEFIPFVNKNGKYMLILKEILSIKNIDFDYLDSTGNPLFFLPFLYGDLKTSKLYIKNNIDINMKNSSGHNLFYEYVLRVFNQNEYFNEFRENLVYLLVNKSNIDSRNKHGQTIFTKVALINNCNLKLFRKLIEVTRYDYTSIDNLGRTIIHSCVWSNNIELLNLVYGVGRNIQNISDNYNILPITYAGLLGNQKMVIEFLRRDAMIKSSKPITNGAKKRFQPMLKNLDKLLIDIENSDNIRKLNIFIEQTKKDFTLLDL